VGNALCDARQGEQMTNQFEDSDRPQNDTAAVDGTTEAIGAATDDLDDEANGLDDEEDDIERRQLEVRALDAAFHLSMLVRSYFAGLHEHDKMLRLWVLAELERQLPQHATQVITAITQIEDIAFFKENCYPRG